MLTSPHLVCVCGWHCWRNPAHVGCLPEPLVRCRELTTQISVMASLNSCPINPLICNPAHRFLFPRSRTCQQPPLQESTLTRVETGIVPSGQRDRRGTKRFLQGSSCMPKLMNGVSWSLQRSAQCRHLDFLELPCLSPEVGSALQGPELQPDCPA